VCAYNRCDYQLSDTHASGDRHRFLAEVYEKYLNLAAIIGIDSTGGIEHSEPMSGRETGTRTYLGFETFRKGDRDTGWNECAAAGCKREGGVSRYRSEQVEVAAVRSDRRRRQVFAVREHVLDFVSLTSLIELIDDA
jgi:hypothetical protein